MFHPTRFEAFLLGALFTEEESDSEAKNNDNIKGEVVGGRAGPIN